MVYCRIIVADYLFKKLLQKVRELDTRGADK